MTPLYLVGPVKHPCITAADLVDVAEASIQSGRSPSAPPRLRWPTTYKISKSPTFSTPPAASLPIRS